MVRCSFDLTIEAHIIEAMIREVEEIAKRSGIKLRDDDDLPIAPDDAEEAD